MSIQFKTGQIGDLPEILQLFKSAVATMDSQGIFQWDEVYPDKAVLMSDIEKAELFIGVIDEKIAVVYVLNHEFDEQYANGAWKCDEDRAIIIHRLCVNPAFQNQGLGRKTVEHIIEQASVLGVKSIRLDAFTQNPFAVRLYEKLGFKTVGFADFRMGKFHLMEKPLV